MRKISKIEPKLPVIQARKKVAAYARVSRDTERLMHSVSAQVSYYSALIQKNPGWEYAGVYADMGISGTDTSKRGEFLRMLADCEEGKIDIILTKSISRFARNTVDLLETVRHLKDLGIEVRFEKEHIHSLSEDGELMLTLLASFAQEESRSISENVKWGVRKRFQSGEIGAANKHILGYRYDDGLRRYVIIPEEAEAVRWMFQMYIDGVPLRGIAGSMNSAGIRTTLGNDFQEASVRQLIFNEVYAGDIRRQKCYMADPITKTKVKNCGELPQYYMADCHEAIIDRETFALVQNLRQHRRRPTRTGAVSMFSGLLYCADCGSKLGYSATNNYKREQAYFFCSGYRKNTDLCSAHYIREKVVAQLVLEGLQRLLWYVQVYEERFAQEQMERFGLQEKRELTAKRRELDKAKQRVSEIDQLIQKSYEDMSKGLLSEERFATLSLSLEAEQKQLKMAIPAMEASLDATTDKAADLQRFIERARQVTRLTELTPEIVHEFIEKIVVSKPDKVNGKRHQRVDIHYNTIGLWTAPEPEEMEKLFQEHLADKRQKTA